MRFILEHQQPFFSLTVVIDVDKNAAGINFLADLNLRRFSLTAQVARVDRRHVH